MRLRATQKIAIGFVVITAVVVFGYRSAKSLRKASLS